MRAHLLSALLGWTHKVLWPFLPQLPRCIIRVVSAADFGSAVLSEAYAQPPERTLLKLLAELKIHCSMKRYGCSWYEHDVYRALWLTNHSRTGPRSNLPAHLVSCPSFPCSLAAEGCLWKGKSDQIETHLRSCDCFPVACTHVSFGPCKWSGQRRHLAQHLLQEDCHGVRKLEQEKRRELDDNRYKDKVFLNQCCCSHSVVGGHSISCLPSRRRGCSS